MWVRWLALSALVPSQQLGKFRVRTTRLPCGHSGYLSVSWRFSKPVQLHDALALATPLVKDLASPMMTRRVDGIAVTLDVGLPPKTSCTEVACRMVPVLPSASGASLAERVRRTGQKYVDLSPRAQVVPAAARDS